MGELTSTRNLGIAAVAIVVILIAGYAFWAPAAAPTTVVQVANPEAAAPAGAPPSGWDTEWSQKISYKLLQTLDSSGPAAWDPVEHPLVFITSLGPGYGGIMSDTQTRPGVVIIDAYTKEIVTSREYDLGAEDYFEPHGLGVSPDGKWIYLPTGMGAGFRVADAGRYLVIDAKTLKIHQIISTPTMPHHVKAVIDSEGRELVLAYTFGSYAGTKEGQFGILDPNDDNRVVGSFTNAQLRGEGYLAFMHPSGKYLFVSTRTRFFTDPATREGVTEGGIVVIDTKTWAPVAKINTEDSSPIWVVFKADGTKAYVTGGHHSTIAEVDTSDENPALWKLERVSRVGTDGPYGLRLSWDEKVIWAIGKGEGSTNMGVTLGFVGAEVMKPMRPGRYGFSDDAKGALFTDCLRGDHITIHPDPAVNEMWLSCNSNWRVVVVDAEKFEVKQTIMMPNGASTHSGAFVRYNPDWTGEEVSGHDGLHGSGMEAKKQLLGIS